MKTVEKPKSSPVLWALALGWGIFVCVVFFKKVPFSPVVILDILFSGDVGFVPPTMVLLHYLAGFLLALALLFNAYGVGRLVLSRWRPSETFSLEQVVISAAIGYAVLAYGALSLGAAGLLYKTLLRSVLGFIFLVTFVWCRRASERALLTGAWQDLKEVCGKNSLHLYLSLLLGFVFVTAFVMAFVPETFYDALVYHLGVPQTYLLEHRVVPISNLHSQFPLTIQMIYLLGLALKNEIVTKFTHLFLMALLAGGMLSLGLRFGKKRLGLISAILFCSIPTVQLNVWNSAIDVGMGVFAFMAVACFLGSTVRDGKIDGWFILSAVFSGLTLASKYTGGLVVIAIAVTILVSFFVHKVPFKTILTSLLVYSGLVLLVMSPWFVKNWLQTGNPVYPFLNAVWGHLPLEPWRYEILMQGNRGYAPESVWEVFKLLWTVSIDIRRRTGFQGPLMLAGLLFLIPALKHNRPDWMRWLGLSGILFLIMGLTVTRLTRFLLPGLTLSAFLIAYGFNWALDDASRFRRFFVLLLLSCGYFLQMSWAYTAIDREYKPRDVLLGRVSRNNYRAQNKVMNPHSADPMFRFMEFNLKPADRVLLIGDEKVYPLKAPYVYSGVFDEGPLIRIGNASKDPQDFAKRLHDEGITHIMINVEETRRLARYGILNWTPEGFERFNGLWKGYLDFVHLTFLELEDDKRYRNPFLLMKVEPNGVGPDAKLVENILTTLYEKKTQPR